MPGRIMAETIDSTEAITRGVRATDMIKMGMPITTGAVGITDLFYQ